MVVLNCPIDGCEYRTEDHGDAAAAALLNAHSYSHAPQGGNNARNKPQKVNRPEIKHDIDNESWAFFVERWGQYKLSCTDLQGRQLSLQLLECCEAGLRQDIFRSEGTIDAKPEDEILNIIKRLAVKTENTMVSRVKLHNMLQDPGEDAKHFAARLLGQAKVCNFTLLCSSADCGNTANNYMEQMVRDQLIKGLYDMDIREQVLGEKDQNMSLKDIIAYIEAKEAGKRSQTSLSSPDTASRITTEYQKKKKLENPHNANKTTPEEKPSFTTPCGHCGNKHQGPHNSVNREKFCRAWGKTCNNCGKSGHFFNKCKAPGVAKSPTQETQPSANTSGWCNITTNRKGKKSITLDHHTFDARLSTWRKQRAQPHPMLPVTVELSPSSYNNLRIPFPEGKGGRSVVPRRIVTESMADTGCQCSLAGKSMIYQMGLRRQDLTPVSQKMKAANTTYINILGAIVIKLSGLDISGLERSTVQICYITDETDKLFLSREACTELGIISKDFPTIGEHQDSASTAQASMPVDENVVSDPPQSPTVEKTCNCLKRSLPPAQPINLPFPATEGNRDKLELWIRNYYAASTFNCCDHQPLPMMSGPPLEIIIDQTATPIAHHTPIPVPIHWRKEVKDLLDQNTRLQVIEPVPIGTPVKWCHRMVVCAKKNGKPRQTVDMQALSKVSSRQTHHTRSPFHQARSVPASTKKTVLDAWNGYHSVPLTDESKDLTTFITEWGRYRYKTCPQGWIASGDGYTHRFDSIISGIERMTKCVDDTILWDDTIEGQFYHVCEFLDRCGRNGITLNPEKFVFAQDTVEFAGFVITPTNVKPCKKYLEAIADFPTPRDLPGIRAWFGLVNQASYCFSMSHEMLPFRDLLKSSRRFYWDAYLQQLFEDSRVKIVEEIKEGVRIFDPERTTCLSTDWSKHGVGFFLLQKHCNCPGPTPSCCKTGWKLTLAGSRFTHDAESNYAPIEGEALAVADALLKTKYFVLGCKDLLIAIDHKPLLKIFGDKSLEAIDNIRLRSLKEKTLKYRFKMIHIPGKKHAAPDAASRYPVGEAERYLMEDDETATMSALHSIGKKELRLDILSALRVAEDDPEDEPSTEEYVKAVALAALESTTPKVVTWDMVRTATASDANMRNLWECIEEGFPASSQELEPSIRPYHQFRSELLIADGCILYKDRVVIPPVLRPRILETLHSAHQGTTSMNSRVESSVFWPGITADVKQVRQRCTPCHEMAPSQPAAPPTPLKYPDYPFQLVCADFFQLQGKPYLVMVDRFSNWPQVCQAKDGARGLIEQLKLNFQTFGIPEELASDGGPEFTAAETQRFFQDWGIHHRQSSVAFPHSNCRAEIGVKTMKRLLTSNVGSSGELNLDNFRQALMQYRNTPDPLTGLSPATAVFGRQLRDFLPVEYCKYKPHPVITELLDQREHALRVRHHLKREELTEHTKNLPPLKVGDSVYVQNQVGNKPRKWDKTGRVIEVLPYDSYSVKMDGSGRVSDRNRKFLRKFDTRFVRADWPNDTRSAPSEVYNEQLRRAFQPDPPASQESPAQDRQPPADNRSPQINQDSPATPLHAQDRFRTPMTDFGSERGSPQMGAHKRVLFPTDSPATTRRAESPPVYRTPAQESSNTQPSSPQPSKPTTPGKKTNNADTGRRYPKRQRKPNPNYPSDKFDLSSVTVNHQPQAREPVDGNAVGQFMRHAVGQPMRHRKSRASKMKAEVCSTMSNWLI